MNTHFSKPQVNAADYAADSAVMKTYGRAEIAFTKGEGCWLISEAGDRYLDCASGIAVNTLGLPGLEFQQEESRVYPHGSLLSHVVGYTDIDNNGISAIEKTFDWTIICEPPVSAAASVKATA